jgi:3-deoxy-manno-octulosonate cytidylyltransferase (CMP-KDO synthetase)
MALPCIVAVPARLESSRLSSKVMAEIGGKLMLQRVLERCSQATAPTAMLLCNDSSDLVVSAASWGLDAILTSPACESGSQRIASVADQLLVRPGSSDTSRTLITNLLGDQPFIDPAVIDAMAAEFNHRTLTPPA